MSDEPAPDERHYGFAIEPWLSPPSTDLVGIAPAPRRAELLDDQADAWWQDVATWTEWAIATFRLTKWFPPCWRRHPALVEEAQALFLYWNAAWLDGTDPTAPTSFLHNLQMAVSRIETLWQIPCNASSHKEPAAPAPPSHQVLPHTEQWWANPDFEP